MMRLGLEEKFPAVAINFFFSHIMLLHATSVIIVIIAVVQVTTIYTFLSSAYAFK